MVFVIATIRLHAGARGEFLTEFGKLVPKVRAETGCLEYGPAVDAETGIEGQVLTGPDTVTVIEKWQSVALLESHLAAEHMVEFRRRVTDLVSEVQLNILQPA